MFLVFSNNKQTNLSVKNGIKAKTTANRMMVNQLITISGTIGPDLFLKKKIKIKELCVNFDHFDKVQCVCITRYAHILCKFVLVNCMNQSTMFKPQMDNRSNNSGIVTDLSFTEKIH